MRKYIIYFFCLILLLSGCKTQIKETAISDYKENPPKTETVQEDEKTVTPIPNKEQKNIPEKKNSVTGKLIVVDAGHGINSYNKQEAIAPGVSETKAAFASGTNGKTYTEEELNLIVAKKLEAKLSKLGADVRMTRTEHKSDMTNIDRAEFANSINADISVKIHADGNNSSGVSGASMLVPSNDYIKNEALCEKSKRAGEIVLKEVTAQTGAANRGVVKRNDLTGFNWTKVPIVLLEMGFMTNPNEDSLLSSADYQDKIVQGIADGLIKYFERE